MTPFRTQLLLIGTMAVWGLNISAVKVLTAHLDPLLIASMRMLLAAVVIHTTLVLVKLPLRLAQISMEQWLRFTLCAALMVYGNQIFFIGGMQTASATNTSLIMALAPLVASVMAAVVFRESLTAIRLLGIVLGFGGVFVVVISGSNASLSGAGWGEAEVMLGMLSFVAGGIMIQNLARQFNALIISAVIYTLGAAMLCVHVFFNERVDFTVATMFPSFWPVALMILSGVFGTAISNMVWNRAIAELGAARASVYQYWVPIFGVGFAMLLLGEPFTAWHLVGLLGILLGTYLGTRK